VLSGEYAVLADAPAVVAAIDRRALVTVSGGSGSQHVLTTPGYLEGSWHFRLREGGVFEWRQQLPDPAAFALFEAIWKCFDSMAWPPLSVSIDTRAFYDRPGGCKLGLGSSAAVSVALIAALQQVGAAAHAPGNSPDNRLDALAFEAHSRFQGGRGSGVDIAASLQGGLLQYRRGSVVADSLAWPEDLQCRFLWSGRPALTADKLALLEANDSAAADSSAQALGIAANNAAAAWSGGAGPQIMDAMREFVDVLRRFSIDLDLGIFEAGHEQLAELAAASGIVYKPCGAGGGDIGVVLAERGTAIDDFCVRASGQGFSLLQLAMDEQGVLTKVRLDLE